MPRRSTGPVDLAGVRLPDVRSGVITDLGTLSGVVVAIRHHG